MYKLYTVFILCALIILVKGNNNCNTKKISKRDNGCNQINAHYFELGCKPVYTNKDGRCPERFDCPFMTRSNDHSKCYLKNKVYSVGDSPSKKEIGNDCSVGCFCNDDDSGKASFTCAEIECPEFFGPPPPEKAHCIQQYKLDDCCSSSEVCDKAEIQKLKNCTYGTETYREGQKFYPENTCKVCVCNKQFDGTLKSSYCKDINCGIELRQSEDIKQRCAPVFFENRYCCPIEWKCYENESIDKSLGKKNSKRNMQCQYGKKLLNIGDKVIVNDDCLTCKCEVPPLVTCIRSSNC